MQTRALLTANQLRTVFSLMQKIFAPRVENPLQIVFFRMQRICVLLGGVLSRKTFSETLTFFFFDETIILFFKVYIYYVFIYLLIG